MSTDITSARTTTGPQTFTVEVSGAWIDPRTRQEAPQTQTFRVLALFPEAAEMAGRQLFTSAAAKARCLMAGDCSARVA